MDERQKLTVPDLVGQPVHIAQEMAANIGFGLAAGDPDGQIGRASCRERVL